MSLKTRTGLLCFLVTAIIISSMASVFPIDDTHPRVLLIRSDSALAGSIFDLVELSNELQTPIVVSSDGPVELEVQIDRTGFIVNVETEELTQGETVSTLITQYAYRYTVIEPGNKVMEMEYVFDTPNEDRFNQAFTAEITRLESVYPAVWKRAVLADYSGDSQAYEAHYYWTRTTAREWAAIDDDDDDYTMELTLTRDVWRSKYDYDTSKKYWDSEWIVDTAFDQADYKASYNTWVGPWVSSRWLKYDDQNLDMHDRGPTTYVGTWSYSISQGIKISGQGPTYQLGVAESWTQSEVEIIDDTSDYYDIVEWREYFMGPNYFYWPFLIEPCDASHHSYVSYRAAEWRGGRYDGGMSGTQYYNAKFHYDTNFVWWIFWLSWDHYTYTISYDDSVSYWSGWW